MPRYRGVGGLVALLFVATCAAATQAQAATLVAPQVYVRPIDPNNATVGVGPWQPLSASVGWMGPYDIGIKLQDAALSPNRQAVDVKLTSDPGGSPPSDWHQLSPYFETCTLRSGAAGTIADASAIVYYHGNGTYRLSVAMYTYDQWSTQSGGFSPCTGGPSTAVTLTVSASARVRIAGTPLVPRVTRRAKGFNGLRIDLPAQNQGDSWRCARNPVLHAGGPVTGTDVTRSANTGAGSTFDQAIETDAFKAGPGRWACSARALSGDNTSNFFGTPWVSTPVTTIRGEYERSNSRLSSAPRGRMRLTLHTPRFLMPAAAGGHLTLAIQLARCASVSKGIVHLRTLVKSRARLDSKGHAVFSLRPPTPQAFYRGYLTFGGTSLLLPGADVPMYLQVTQPPNPHLKPRLHFVPPTAWAPCP